MNSAILLGGLAAIVYLITRRSKPATVAPETVEPATEPESRVDPSRFVLTLPKQLFLSGPLLTLPTSNVEPTGDIRAQVLTLLNQKRSSPQSCGGQPMPAVPPLSMNSQLTTAANLYAKDMADRGFFSHYDPEGDSPTDRIQDAGYVGVAYGENIAAGQATPQEAMIGWMNSPGHCRNNMSAQFNEVGIGYYFKPDDTYKHYWVLNFGRR